MLQGAMAVWFALTAGSLAFVVWDSAVNGVTSWVQRVAWILVTVYGGPVALVLYLLACRRPFPGAHEEFTRPTWKQGLNSEMHCLAGDATGIAISAAIVAPLGLANGWDAVIEYVGGFVVGLFIFQALMMRGMFGGDYLMAVRKTLFVETLSMNFVMVGMIPVMVVLASWWPESMDPLQPEFWFRMSIAALVGGVLAFPVNVWLVARHIKHGCMTLPGADGPAPAMGHVAMEPVAAGHGAEPMAMAMSDARSGHTTPPMSTGEPHAEHSQEGSEEAMEMHGHQMEMPTLPMPLMVALIVGSYTLLLVAVWLTAQVVPITF